MPDFLIRCECNVFAYERAPQTIAVNAANEAEAHKLALDAYDEPLAQTFTVNAAGNRIDHPLRLRLRHVVTTTLTEIDQAAKEALSREERTLHADLSALHSRISDAARGRL